MFSFLLSTVHAQVLVEGVLLASKTAPLNRVAPVSETQTRCLVQG